MKSHPTLKKTKKGFTLIEIMVALGVLGAVLGMILNVLMKGLSMRQDSADIVRATFLAEEKMNEIKAIMRTESNKGEFEAFPSYSYEYDITEETLDLAKLAEDFGAEDRLASSEELKYLRDRSGGEKSTTGMVFKMLKYYVVVNYPSNKKFDLTFYRGLGIF